MSSVNNSPSPQPSASPAPANWASAWHAANGAASPSPTFVAKKAEIPVSPLRLSFAALRMYSPAAGAAVNDSSGVPSPSQASHSVSPFSGSAGPSPSPTFGAAAAAGAGAMAPSPRRSPSPQVAALTPRGGRVTPMNMDLFFKQQKALEKLKSASGFDECVKIWDEHRAAFTADHMAALFSSIKAAPICIEFPQIMEQTVQLMYLRKFSEDQLKAIFHVIETYCLAALFQKAVAKDTVKLPADAIVHAIKLTKIDAAFRTALLDRAGESREMSPVLKAGAMSGALVALKTAAKAATAAGAAAVAVAADSPRRAFSRDLKGAKQLLVLGEKPHASAFSAGGERPLSALGLKTPDSASVKGMAKKMAHIDVTANVGELHALSLRQISHLIDELFRHEILTGSVIVTKSEQCERIAKEIIARDLKEFDTDIITSILTNFARMTFLNKSPLLVAKLETVLMARQDILDDASLTQLIDIGWALALSLSKHDKIMQKVIGLVSEQYESIKDHFDKLKDAGKLRQQISQMYLHWIYFLKKSRTVWGSELVQYLDAWKQALRDHRTQLIQRHHQMVIGALPEALRLDKFQPVIGEFLLGNEHKLSAIHAEMYAVLREVLKPYRVEPEIEMVLDGVEVDLYVEIAGHGRFVFEADGAHHFRDGAPDGSTLFRNAIVPEIIKGKSFAMPEGVWNSMKSVPNWKQNQRQYFRDCLELDRYDQARVSVKK